MVVWSSRLKCVNLDQCEGFFGLIARSLAASVAWPSGAVTGRHVESQDEDDENRG